MMQTETQIRAERLTRTFRAAEREEGLRASLRSVVRRRFREVTAVEDVSFSVAAGEIVGFLGPNGAGKTTTLKMLAGLMHPSGGTARVAGHVPWERKPEFLQKISMVLGNKSQLVWGLPPLDTYRVLGEIYGVPDAARKRIVDELVALLELEHVVATQARHLSLGERMKCELVAALLHQPAVLFLDEPTLGLDVSMQQRLRLFIGEYNRRTGATIVLTSHYMADVTALCKRVIVIHRGRLIHDGDLRELAQRFAPFKLIDVVLDDPEAAVDGALTAHLPEGVEVLEAAAGRVRLRVERGAVATVTARLLQALPVSDLSVEDPPIESIVEQLYRATTTGEDDSAKDVVGIGATTT